MPFATAPPGEGRTAARPRAAFELFAERGYPHVTVADIAERAEVGRTTFFRYFGDKQEVVFYDEQSVLDGIIERYHEPLRRPRRRVATTAMMVAVTAAAGWLWSPRRPASCRG